MEFENIQPLPPDNREKKIVGDELKSEDQETILEKIRQKTGHVARGLALIGGLSISGCDFDKYSPGLDPGHQPTELSLHLSEKKLSQIEYSKLCQENPEKAFVTSPLYRNETWLAASLEKAAKYDPFNALQYASRLSG